MKSEPDHDHGFAPPFLPHWMQERWALLTVTVSSLALIVGFFGEKFFGLPSLGGMSVSVVTMFIAPCLFSAIEEWKWKRGQRVPNMGTKAR